MPKLNSRGSVLAGGFNSPVHVDGVIPPPLRGVECSLPCWLDDDTIIYQARRADAYQIECLDLRTMTVELVERIGSEPVQKLVAGGGRWAAQRGSG